MGDDSFILMNLKDSKEIAAAMQNETAQKILDYLTKGKASESEISKDLGLAISTVHYNLQQLKKAKLVKAEEYTYSKRGKEILHYSLAKKLIIIAPAGEENNWKDLLKKIVPSFAIAALIGWIFQKISQQSSIAQMAIKAESGIATRSFASEIASDEMIAAAMPPAGGGATSFWSSINSFEWFIIGAITVIAMLLIVELFASKQWFKLKKH